MNTGDEKFLKEPSGEIFGFPSLPTDLNPDADDDYLEQALLKHCDPVKKSAKSTG